MSGLIPLSAVVGEALDEIAKRSKKTIYQNDYLAWASDVLGRRYYERMAGIMDEVAHSRTGKTRTAVKSANGTGKSYSLSDFGTWWVTAFPPEESLAIFTANGRDQIERVVFKYLKDNYGYMKTHGYNPPGQINESLEWKYEKLDGSGKEAIAFGKRPADQDIVSSFQGTRKPRTMVGLDEMGGLPEDLLTAAEAVTTGGETCLFGIGNPDRRGTLFHRLWTNKTYAADWNLHTISAYDLPTMTGEDVYPNDPVRQEAMLSSGMTTRRWVEHKERAWQDDDAYGVPQPNALFKSKVLGIFPDEGDTTFFPENYVTAAQENQIDPQGGGIGGVDLGFAGEDESVFTVNDGGHCRVFDKQIAYRDDSGEVAGKTTGSWGKAETIDSARRIHAIAHYCGLSEVRVDASGAGVGVFNELNSLREFRDKEYTLIGIRGGTASSDRNQWAKARDEHHSSLKEQLRQGALDIDPDDSKLRDELLIITYKMNDRGAVVITPKKELKNEFGGSPDRLDSLIYATVGLNTLLKKEPEDLETGQRIMFDAYEFTGNSFEGAGLPI